MVFLVCILGGDYEGLRNKINYIVVIMSLLVCRVIFIIIYGNRIIVKL